MSTNFGNFDSGSISGRITMPIDPTTSLTSIANGTILPNITENHVQGKMFSVSFSVSEFELINSDMPDDEIKKKLAYMIADELLKEKHIEFTSQSDLATASRIFRARLFAVPDTQVRILRVANKK